MVVIVLSVVVSNSAAFVERIQLMNDGMVIPVAELKVFDITE